MPTFKRADQEQFEKAQDLLEAGPAKELGFAKSLFFGRLKLDQVLPYPQQDADEARAHRRSDREARRVPQGGGRPRPDRREERIPQHVIDGLGKLGVLGMTVPRNTAAAGSATRAYCRVLEHIARHCASTAVLVGAHQSIGLKALLLMGTEQQKREFLPALARGEKLAAFCLSEPEVGSDAANVQTHARLSDDGTHWILNGEKKFATNAALAGMMTVMAKTPVTDEKGKTHDKVTAFIVTPDLPGFEIVKHNRSKMGIRGSWQATLRFNDMRVPRDRVLGEVGKGLKVALSVLDYGRCTLSAGCVGGAKKALELAVEQRAHAQAVRPHDRRVSPGQGEDRAHGRDDLRDGCADVPRGGRGRSPRHGHHARDRHLQALLLRRPLADQRRRAADLGRRRLHGRERRRAGHRAHARATRASTASSRARRK